MLSKKQTLITTVNSMASLALAFVLVLIINWGFKNLGAWYSGFPGVIKWDGVHINAFSETWNQKQVLSIYLFPYLGFVLVYLIASVKRRVPLKMPSGIHLFYSWLYTLLIVIVFLVPIYELLNKEGIYFAVSWLYLNRFEKILFAFVLIILFAIRVFRISPVFSTVLVVKPYTFIKSTLFIQLIFLWYIPYLLLFISVIVISPHFSFYNNGLLVGLFVTLLINTPLIAKYKVIIK